MDVILGNPASLWIVAGILLVLFEACTVPGIGIFLGGLGAISTGALIHFGIVSDKEMLIQFAWFFGLSALWTAALWKPLKRFRIGRKDGRPSGFSDMVGEKAIVGKGGLNPNYPGQVSWSGTIMTAEIDPSVKVESIPEGTVVRITSVSGTMLRVVPK